MKKFCISVGGNLASLHNSGENTFVSDMITRLSGSRSTWVGGYDAVDEKRWLWSDGSSFEFDHWYSNQPDNSGDQHCMEINYGGDYWNDMQCTYGRPFVCSQDL
ncbi:galactose-specific lectin nattectin-like [Gambusia affinis]|uniref:galactose-specific lectin nattectin-like n=1 Tax=Gambusia affinis TaxID=33528 RepID=UPI001CDD3691|nr:galactose-specific lectin nattectin-like [Gambusia affinis]